MKKHLRLPVFLLILGLAFSLIGCSLTPPDEPTPPDGPDPSEKEEEQPSELLLIEDKKANFSIVYTSASGFKAEDLARSLYDRLDHFSAIDKKPKIDTDAEAVTDFEVIIGVNPKNRGEKVLADKKTVGEKDWTVELVGKKVLIYGGSDDALQSAYDYFVGTVLKLSASSQKISKTVKIEAATFGKTSKYLESFTVGGADLKDFTIVYDGMSINSYDLRNTAFDIQKKLADLYGLDLPVKASSEVQSYEKTFLLKQTAEAGDTSFRLRAEGKQLLLEYEFVNNYKRLSEEFVKDKLSTFKGKVALNNETVFTLAGDTVTYEDFGAKGDGKTDDFLAIVQTHNSANTYGQKVGARSDATYYIGSQYSDMSATIKTDVDWNGASFIIDDRGETVEKNRAVKTFRAINDNWAHTFTAEELAGKSLAAGAANVGFKLESDSLLLLENTNAPMFIRWGINYAHSGSMFKTTEVILVDKDGNVDPTTPVLYNYDSFTKIVSFPTDSTPITIENGNFTTYANDARSEYGYYYRGIYIERAHVTVKNLNHTIEKEFDQGKPYDAFLSATYATDVEFRDCNLQAHKMYRVYNEPDNTMGSYDTQAILANDIRWVNCKQTNSLIDQTYWGIHTSDFTKNLYVEGCEFNRVDAHTGVHNFKAVDTVCGLNINMVGSGDLILTRVVRQAGEEFIYLRDDYGSTWNGDVVITDCEHQGYIRKSYGEPGSTYVAGINALVLYHTSFRNWDFGYDCYAPQNTTINGLKCGIDGKATLTLFSFAESSAKPTVNTAELLKVAATNTDRGTGVMNVLHKPQSVTINDLVCKNYVVCNNPTLLRNGDLKITDNR